ncbi:MAG TPA: LamG domain-containing protein, partial [Candidatus Nitrosotenuis sp.]
EGAIENTIPQVSSTDTDVVIGATLDTRAVDKAQKVFSGGIDQLEIYDRYLTAEQIHGIYTRTFPIIMAKYINITVIQTIPEPINLLNQTSVNGTLNTNSTEYVIVPIVNQTNQMTISTWVTPQYDGASDELTILSKEGSFVLSLNNVISPEYAAKFAVFDGIRWTVVQGATKIHDTSHVVAVINGTEISLYVNGILQEKQTLPEPFTISEGDLAVSEVANSESDIVIGAYISTVRSEQKLSNKFSGVIDDVVIYSKALSYDEIEKLYHIVSYNTKLSLFESLGMSDSTYSELIFQNVTTAVLTVDPILNQTKASYLINEGIEFQLQYYNDYEVLMKQLQEMKGNLSVLTKNTEQNLTQIETQIVNGDRGAYINQKELSQNSINIKPINYVVSTFIPVAHADNSLSPSSFNVLNEIAQTKEKIQELQEKINLINQNGTTDEQLLHEIKDQIETVSENLRSISGNMTSVNLYAKSKQIDNLAETFESMVTENVTEVQYEKWQEQNDVITAEIYDPQGKLI